MRAKPGLAGATLLYGARRRMPDLALAMQFLLDDLRAQDRVVQGLRLTPSSLRLRLDGYELAMSLAGPLPPHAFAGARRPVAADGDLIDPAQVRVLHALRTHRWALGMLLRSRGRARMDDRGDPLAGLVADCRSMLAPVLESAPPDLVLWQPGALACTPGEFTALRSEAMMEGGGWARPLPPLAPRRAGGLSDVQALPALAAGTAPPRPVPVPERHERAARRSAGRLFGRGEQAGLRALPGLDHQDQRLARALRTGAEREPQHRRDPFRALVLAAAVLLPSLVVLAL